MNRENKSKYSVLGILCLHPMSGYDIKKTIEGSLSNFWRESYGQIYPILKSLVAEGLATSSVEEQTGRPDRYVYTLTEAGRKELRLWLSKPAEHEVGRIEILLKLFFGWHIPVEGSLHKVEEFRARQQSLLQKYAAIEQHLKETETGQPGLPYWLMTVSYGQHVSRALTDWCDETLSTLKSLDAAQAEGNANADQSKEGKI